VTMTQPTAVEEMESNILAAGGVFGVALTAGLNPVVVMDNGLATNVLTVKLPYLKSRYRLTVERFPDDEETVG
jgi:hypothetical protein